ncbi:MAG: SAM hydrolase/SAM-dependent halogenase family protein [Fervidicoccaceae archaeon]|nr:MAG: hypothetical protein C0179_05020 [Fervidicoccus sp.]
MRVLVLLTDFGTRDPYASLMRAAARRIKPDIVIEDLTHGIPRYCITCGAYVLYTSYEWFPEDSIYVSVVDPGVGSSRRGILVKVKERYFIGPDNGILWPVIEENLEDSEAFALDEEKVSPWEVSSTFHGRDVFAPAAARIARGEDPSSFAYRIELGSLRTLSLTYSRDIEGGKCFKVIYIDSFGDVVLSSRGEEAEKVLSTKRAKVFLEGREIGEAEATRTFSLVSRGEIALYVNSSGFLELSVNMGDFAEKFGVEIGDEICLKQ